MSIGIVTQDLVTRVKSVASYNNRVGLAVGGKGMDPMNRELTRPAAWVIYSGDSALSTDPNSPSCIPLVSLNFIVTILVDYDDESSLISTHLPLLHETILAIQGNEPIPGSKWIYNGQALTELTERMVWEQSYTILMGVA